MRRQPRIIGGQAKSHRLRVPVQPAIRPTMDVIREAIFSSLGTEVMGARFADLYAGSGAVGIEALSRGATLSVFVDCNRSCTDVIASNLENIELAERAVVLTRRLPEAWTQIAEAYGPFDIVFVDPPYGSAQLLGFAQQLVRGREGLSEEAIVVLEHEQGEAVLQEPSPEKIKTFGKSQLDIYYIRAAAEGGR